MKRQIFTHTHAWHAALLLSLALSCVVSPMVIENTRWAVYADNITYCKTKNCSTRNTNTSTSGGGAYQRKCVDWWCSGSTSPTPVPNTGTCRYREITGKTTCEFIAAVCGAGSYIIEHISCEENEQGRVGWSVWCESRNQVSLYGRDAATCCITCDPSGSSSVAVNVCLDVTPPGWADPNNCNSPIVIDLGNSGSQLTDFANGVMFDLNCDGQEEQTAWTSAGSDDALLCLDRNSNGIIDNGWELFGSLTAQYSTSNPNGYNALSVFDSTQYGGNHDGLISSQDTVFSQLRLWLDENHNGVSESSELKSLAQLGVTTIWIDYVETPYQDLHGNWYRFISSALRNGSSVATSDVFFAQS